ncbi:transposable element Tc3 transposase [Trichonephila clavipes]|nr:transposable element Tc3 transposase [Trichonephila clavipes]
MEFETSTLGCGRVGNVMFSDESQFSLRSDSRRVTIWREHETRFEPRNIPEKHHFPSRAVMVWAGIMMDATQTSISLTRGSATAQRYRDEVLEPFMLASFEVLSVLTSYSWMIMRYIPERC